MAGGKRARKRRSVKERARVSSEMEEGTDRISDLPRHLIDQILSHLPLKGAVRTCILSRKWRYMWTSIPDLVLDEHFMRSLGGRLTEDKFVKIIDQILLFHTGPIQRFELFHRKFAATSDLGRWIFHLSRASVKNLSLNMTESGYEISSSLYVCQNLVHLNLVSYRLKPPPSFKGFKCLTSLELQLVKLRQHELENLILSCPLLQTLKLRSLDGVNRMNINAPNLQYLEFEGSLEEITFGSNMLETVAITFSGLGSYPNYEADPGYSHLPNFFVNLCHLKSLRIEVFLRYLSFGEVPEILPNPCLLLECISMWIEFIHVKQMLAALCLLRSSPNLQKLEVYNIECDCAVSMKVDWVYYSSKCWFERLKFVPLWYMSCTGWELDFIRLLLSCSPVLEKMHIRVPMHNRKDHPKFLEELMQFQPASNRVQVVIADIQFERA